MSLNDLNIIEARKGLEKKKFSVAELVKDCLKRIQQTDDEINAFLTVCEKEAIEDASKKDALLKDKVNWKQLPLLGIPLAIKDLFLTEGIRTTAGSRVLANYIPQYDSTVVSRLKEAGAIIIGKTNLDAWAHGSSGENSDFGLTRNPWNLNLTPGGSSSGSGASLAADMCLGATGTDTGGSIRLPASFCNQVGLKPTYGRVSRYGVIAMASSFDCPGCLAKTVADQAVLLQVVAGYDQNDATSMKEPVPNYSSFLGSDLKGLKAGIPREYFTKGVCAEVKTAVLKAIEKLSKLGVEATPVSLPHTEYAIACYYILVSSEISSNLARYDGIRYGSGRNSFGDEAKRRIMLGTYSLSTGYYDAYYLKAQKVRTLIKKDFEKVFEKVDILIAPTSPTFPFKLGEKVDDPLTMYLSDVLLCPANIAGMPSLSLTCGFSQDNLPIGMQIIGRQFNEGVLLQVGDAYEKMTDWHLRKPKLD